MIEIPGTSATSSVQLIIKHMCTGQRLLEVIQGQQLLYTELG